MQRLRSLLLSIEGKGFKAYKRLSGSFQWPSFTLDVDHIQGDAYAAPSRFCARVPMSQACIPPSHWHSPIRKLALEDYLARMAQRAIKQCVKGGRGTGHSGEIAVCAGPQQVLARNTVQLSAEEVQLRFTMGLPSAGRSVRIAEAHAMFFDELPEVVAHSLYFAALDESDLVRHIECVEDQEALRAWLQGQGCVAFIGNGACLARVSGVDDRPLPGQVPFQSPPSLQRSVDLPNTGPIEGMAIAEGVNLIVGGGFHGKSTLLHALERGVYNHIPGDGRERVVTRPNAVKIRAEDGRAISQVDISPFIKDLPFAQDTVNFSTQNASGSTSQASNIIEALQARCELLLIDEDTSATNFMIRDQRMQALVAADKEPITPLVQRIRHLYERGVSAIIVMGGSGDYFDVADKVIMMDAYRPQDVTQQARQLARSLSSEVKQMPDISFSGHRRPSRQALSALNELQHLKMQGKGRDKIQYGCQWIDLSAVDQLVDSAQTRAIALIIYYYAQRYRDMHADLISGLCQVLADVQDRGLDILSPYRVGDLALPRLYEVAAAINRLRQVAWE